MTRYASTPVGDAVAGSDAAHRDAMRTGSDALRDRILDTLNARQERFSEQIKRHDAARRAIAKGIDRDQVMSLFDLSATAYDDLAGQVRAGAV